MTIAELEFSDLGVGATPASSWFKVTPDSLNAQAIPAAFWKELTTLREFLTQDRGKTNFVVRWPAPDGVRMRVLRRTTAEGETIFVCRKFLLTPSRLSDLGMPPAVAEAFLAPDLREGLVVFMGKAGSGKNTTASAFVIERLARYGGVCWTVENPIEIHMQGRYGEGICYQIEVDTDDAVGATICELYRATPNIIMIGEARNRATVREALTASTSGHLVALTFHAADLLTGIARLARLADDPTATIALADGLKAAVHLDLQHAGRESARPSRVLVVQSLFIGTEADGPRAIMREGNYHLLRSEVERQRRVFMSRG